MNFRFFKRSRNRNVSDEQTEPRKVPTLLETLTEGDRNLHDALSYYLLLDPKSQIPLLGTPEFHYENGLKYKEKGNQSSARYEFELAARIAISSVNVEQAREYLTLADSVSDSAEQMIHHKTLLMNLNKVEQIATRYYGGKKCDERREKIPIKAFVHYKSR